MKYDLGNPAHRHELEGKLERLLARRSGIVELTECKPQRTIRQNKYLHLIIAYFAAEYGADVDYVKEQYFKLAANKHIFLVAKDDTILGKVQYLKSSSQLDMEEMRVAIERFRNWASAVAGIYLPSAEEHRLLELAEIEISRNKEYI